MRSNKKLPVLALVALAASLSLTVCDPGDPNASNSSGASDTTASSGAGAGQNGSSAPPTTSGKSDDNVTDPGDDNGSTPPGGDPSRGTTDSTCDIDDLSFYAAVEPKGTLTVRMENDGTKTCTLQGFPGAKLTNDNGDVFDNFDLDSTSVSKVMTLRHGDMAAFQIRYPTGQSGTDYTKVIVTTPGSKTSKTTDPIDSYDGAPITLSADAHVTLTTID